MADHWAQVREILITLDDIPPRIAERLIASAQRDSTRRPQQCAGAMDEAFCCAVWLSRLYWKHRAGGYVPFSWRRALE